MFHLDLAKVMQMGFPISVLLEILGDTLREQDVSAIAAIHYSLGHVDPGPGRMNFLENIAPFVTITRSIFVTRRRQFPRARERVLYFSAPELGSFSQPLLCVSLSWFVTFWPSVKKRTIRAEGRPRYSESPPQ